jgi:hypothetical protein
MSLFQIDPIRVFQIKGHVSPLKNSSLIHTVGANRQVVAAVTGQRIRVMGWLAQSTGAAVSNFGLKSASGGTFILAGVVVPMITNGVIDKLPIVETGYCETNTGEGLFVDVITSDLSLNLFYITYTP